MFLLVLSRVFGGEVVPPRRWLGAGLAMAGALSIAVPDLWTRLLEAR